MAINWDDPNTQGLMTLAAGLLQNSGWSKTPITLGQAFGQAAPEALNTMQRIKRFNMEAADTDQQRQLRGAQLQKVLFENQMDGLLPGQMSMLQRFPGEEVPQADPNIAMREQLLGPFAGGQQGDWADPVVRPFSPAQAPAGQVLPEDAQAISAPQAPASGVPQETLVIGDQAKTLDEMANRMEDRLSMPPNPNNPSVPWHPQAIAAEQRKIAGIRARAERIRKEFDRDRAAPKTEVEVSEDGTKQRNVAWNPKTQKYDIPLGGWRQVFSDKPLVQIDARSLAENKYAGKFGEGIAEKDLAQRDAAVSAVENVGKLDSLISHLKTSDAITGMGAELFKDIERAKTLFTGNIKAGKKVSDTEILDAFLGSDVFAMIQGLGIGARGLDTPVEREFLRQVMTGTITMNKNTLIKLSTIRRDIATRAVEKWNARLKEIPESALQGTGLSREPVKLPVSNSPDGKPAAKDFSGREVRKYNPATGKIE